MFSPRNVNRYLFKALACGTLLLVIFNEFFIYIINQQFWNKPQCESGNCTRILLVADPQLLGTSFDLSFYNGLAIGDSDRYLKKTFAHAVHFANPHVLCFLGDLLDEGSVASPDSFKTYVHRFQNIFYINQDIKRVHVPGDNDIGGENGEYISNSNIRRFEIEFTNNDIFDYENRLRFFKINRMLLDFLNPDKSNNVNKIRIGVSHMPILIAGGPLLRSIMTEIDPHVIFSAHWHESRIFKYPSTSSSFLYQNDIQTFNLKQMKDEHEYLEIMVPTSSYRMGTDRIGYGLAVFDNYNLRYTVLWNFSRFIFLKVYISWVAMSAFIALLLLLKVRCIKRLNNKKHRNDRISLLSHF